MTNLQIMKKHLEASVIQPLLSQGFTGKYPHFRREKENCIELIAFQTNKYGGSFTVEVSAIFPHKEKKNFVLDNGMTVDNVNVWYTNNRCRLKGMYGGWFYYRDLYCKHIFGFGKDYISVSENNHNFAIPKGAKNKSEIYEFIDYILRPDVMAKIVSSYPYKNLNKETDLLLDESYLNNNAANIPDIIMGEGIFVKNIGDKVKLYDQIWAEIK